MERKGNYKHGGAHTRLYNIWKSMRQRCMNPRNCRYYVYGANGVRICDEWNRFEMFREWAEQNGYSENLTIDRIDTDGDYSPNNCRWVSQKIQQNNRKNNHRIACDGIEHTVAEWADITGLKAFTIYARLRKGWSAEKAVKTPCMKAGIK